MGTYCDLSILTINISSQEETNCEDYTEATLKRVKGIIAKGSHFINGNSWCIVILDNEYFARVNIGTVNIFNREIFKFIQVEETLLDQVISKFNIKVQRKLPDILQISTTMANQNKNKKQKIQQD